MCKKKLFFIILLLVIVFSGCKEEFPAPIHSEGTAPVPITSVKVKNIPGGATLKYSLPENEDILYVKAVYEYPKGNIRDVKASTYVDSLTIVGIGDTNPLEVKLFTINRGEQYSTPFITTITPETPPVLLVKESLSVQETFGGVIVFFANSERADVVITILANKEGEWQPIETLYTNKIEGYFSARGQDASLTEFGVFVRDRWYNKSDTIKSLLTPIFEIKIPSPTPVITLHNDYNKHYHIYKYDYLFDGIVANLNYAGTLLNSPESKLPQSFTMDFKVPTEFSRFKYWMRPPDLFNFGAPEIWEIWGTNELDADWSKWTFIGEFKAVKPSGLPVGTMNAEDKSFAEAGLDFDFPPATPKFRYLRWKSTKNFGSVDYIQFSELTFWGNQ